MKKLMFILLSLVLMLPLSGAKKMDVIHSVWMISHPVFEDISCIAPNTGKLNEPRVEYFAQIAQNCGATGMRILPGLLIDYKLFPGAKVEEYNYLPWQWNGERFDLSRQNSIYFENLEKLAKILKKHGLMLVFSMYDRCHWDNGRDLPANLNGEKGVIPHSPFFCNVNNVSGMYTRTPYHDQYEDYVLKILLQSGCQFKIEFCNEPRVDPKTYISFTKPILEKCYKAGIKQNQLLGGIEWFLNGVVNEKYASWRHPLNFTDSFEGGKKDEEVGYAVVHGFTQYNLISEHVFKAQDHSRRFFMSTDGLTITRKDIEKNLLKYFVLPINKTGIRIKNWCFEWLYQGKGTELYGTMGISEAIYKTFGYYPGGVPFIDENLNDPGIHPPKPERKITITSPQEGETWKPGEPHDIRWITTGTVGNIKIEYSTGNGASWTIITPSTDNNGVHPWVVPEIPAGQCLVKVSEINGDPADTKAFTVAEKPTETEPQPTKKGNKVWWYVVLAVISAAVVFCFLKYTIVTSLVLAVLLFGVTYIGYIKKWKYYYLYLIAAFAIVLATGILTESLALSKVLFGGAMGVVVALSLIVDNFHKKIKELRKK